MAKPYHDKWHISFIKNISEEIYFSHWTGILDSSELFKNFSSREYLYLINM